MTTTTAPPRWGHYSSNATREYPTIAWSVLTPPQTDVVYLSVSGLSQRAIALLYHVSQPAIAKHHRKALERLSATQPRPRPAGDSGTNEVPKDGIPAQEFGSSDDPKSGLFSTGESEWPHRAPGRLCDACDCPHLPCSLCVDTTMRRRP